AAHAAAGQNAARDRVREDRGDERCGDRELMRGVRVGGESERASGAESARRLDRAREEEMRTDDLIAMLSTNVEPVDRRKLVRTFGAALAIGGAAAVCVVL